MPKKCQPSIFYSRKLEGLQQLVDNIDQHRNKVDFHARAGNVPQTEIMAYIHIFITAESL